MKYNLPKVQTMQDTSIGPVLIIAAHPDPSHAIKAYMYSMRGPQLDHTREFEWLTINEHLKHKKTKTKT